MTDDDFDFGEWLKELSHGSANKQLGRALREVIAACRESGGKGSIVLTIKVAAGDGLADVAAEVKTTRPRPKLPGASYFLTDENTLVSEDPRQANLPLKTLPFNPIKDRS